MARKQGKDRRKQISMKAPQKKALVTEITVISFSTTTINTPVKHSVTVFFPN